MGALVEIVGPWLADRGFKQDGASFRRFSETGDCLLVQFQPAHSATGDTFRFYLNIGLVLHSWLEWKAIQASSPSYVPKIDDAQLWSRLRDPSAEQFKDDWRVGVTPAHHSEAASRVVTCLEDALDTYSAHVDRARLLAALRSGGHIEATMVNRRTAQALLLMDHGQSAELEQLLNKLRLRGPEQSALADWIWRGASDVR